MLWTLARAVPTPFLRESCARSVAVWRDNVVLQQLHNYMAVDAGTVFKDLLREPKVLVGSVRMIGFADDGTLKVTAVKSCASGDYFVRCCNWPCASRADFTGISVAVDRTLHVFTSVLWRQSDSGIYLCISSFPWLLRARRLHNVSTIPTKGLGVAKNMDQERSLPKRGETAVFNRTPRVTQAFRAAAVAQYTDESREFWEVSEVKGDRGGAKKTVKENSRPRGRYTPSWARFQRAFRKACVPHHESVQRVGTYEMIVKRWKTMNR